MNHCAGFAEVVAVVIAGLDRDLFLAFGIS